MKNPKILIIGAGPSGIAASCRLKQNNFKNLTIYEAENRIGGRVFSLKVGDAYVDMGAQWCHGQAGNVVYGMVKDMKVLHSSLNRYDDLSLYESDGTQVNRQTRKELEQVFNEIMENIENQQESIDCSVSYSQYVVKLYNERVRAKYGNDTEKLEIAGKVLRCLKNMYLVLESADSWDDVAAISDYKETEGDQLLNWGKEGFRRFLDILMKKYPNPSEALAIEDKIKLNKEVSKIVWNKSSGVQVSCADGTTETFDHVIFTCSLGVLKEQHNSIFEPPLPTEKQNSIEGVSFGRIDKIFLKFSTKWWPKGFQGFNFVWRDEDSATVLKEFPEGPSFNGHSWLESLFGFYTIDSHDDILLGWIIGPNLPEVEKISDDVMGRGCVYILNRFLKNHYTISALDKCWTTKWFSNKHFRGSYSYAGIEQCKRKATRTALAEPLRVDGKLLVQFAGEATNSDHFATVHGAVETGFREADRLIDLYKN